MPSRDSCPVALLSAEPLLFFRLWLTGVEMIDSDVQRVAPLSFALLWCLWIEAHWVVYSCVSYCSLPLPFAPMPDLVGYCVMQLP